MQRETRDATDMQAAQVPMTHQVECGVRYLIDGADDLPVITQPCFCQHDARRCPFKKRRAGPGFYGSQMAADNRVVAAQCLCRLPNAAQTRGALVVAVSVLGLALRLYRLGHDPLWFDEAYTTRPTPARRAASNTAYVPSMFTSRICGHGASVDTPPR